MAAHAVAGGYKMDNENLGAFTRRVDDIKRQVNDGSLSYVLAMRDLQKIIDRKPLMFFDTWHRGVLINQFYVDKYVGLLSIRGYYLDEDVSGMLRSYQHLPMPYLADFGRLTLDQLGFDSGEVSYKKIFERAEEIVTNDLSSDMVGPPTLDVGLSLALALTPSEVNLHDEIVVVTEPWQVERTKLLLVIGRDFKATHIKLKSVEEIELDIAAGALTISFAIMSRPYYSK